MINKWFNFQVNQQSLTKLFCVLLMISILLMGIYHYVMLMAPSADNNRMPKTMLWVWEYPTDLSYVDPKKIGVATLIASCDLSSSIHCYHRQQPLWLPPHTYQLAVIRLKISSIDYAIYDDRYADVLAQKIYQQYLPGRYQGLQIDFDAPVSLRNFYFQILTMLRYQLTINTDLSITALTSWCTSDRWMDKSHLPINYAVPMFYDLDPHFRVRWQIEQSFSPSPSKWSPYCQHAIGLAGYSPWQPSLSIAVPVFIFTKGAWQPQQVVNAIKLVKGYQ